MDDTINDPLSYEEQQLQLILLNEVKKRSLQEERQVRDKLLREERQVREYQDIEYQESLLKDMEKKTVSVKEVSIEEMRQIRLKRFA